MVLGEPSLGRTTICSQTYFKFPRAQKPVHFWLVFWWYNNILHYYNTQLHIQWLKTAKFILQSFRLKPGLSQLRYRTCGSRGNPVHVHSGLSKLHSHSAVRMRYALTSCLLAEVPLRSLGLVFSLQLLQVSENKYTHHLCHTLIVRLTFCPSPNVLHLKNLCN